MRTDTYTDIRTDRQTDRQTDVIKLIVAFRKFSKAPKNECSEVQSVCCHLWQVVAMGLNSEGMVRCCIVLVDNQLDAQIFHNTYIYIFVYIYKYLFKSSTCFEHLCAHPQEDNCMNTTSGIITLC